MRSSNQAVRQGKQGQIPSFSTFCYIQAFNGLDDVYHVEWGGQSTLLRPLTQM